LVHLLVRRFDLDGNLLQRINIEGNRIDELNAVAERARQNASPNFIEAGNPYLMRPSILDGHNLLVPVSGFGSLVLHYDENDIIDAKLIKYDIITEDKFMRWTLDYKDCNNIKFLYDNLFSNNVFINKD